ncbi:hypothetical protein CYY_001270 [Polysphondylium violaceum]|uniref:Uncharacterized protein n=1 Tax=Polysphondylium violaceum TaxID=133409 RepID=A0A8J4Q0D1_9MYCE|nr:hypothetical protein CYY_001270 [Polysphondylium violaceum]
MGSSVVVKNDNGDELHHKQQTKSTSTTSFIKYRTSNIKVPLFTTTSSLFSPSSNWNLFIESFGFNTGDSDKRQQEQQQQQSTCSTSNDSGVFEYGTTTDYQLILSIPCPTIIKLYLVDRNHIFKCVKTIQTVKQVKDITVFRDNGNLYVVLLLSNYSLWSINLSNLLENLNTSNHNDHSSKTTTTTTTTSNSTNTVVVGEKRKQNDLTTASSSDKNKNTTQNIIGACGGDINSTIVLDIIKYPCCLNYYIDTIECVRYIYCNNDTIVVDKSDSNNGNNTLLFLLDSNDNSVFKEARGKIESKFNVIFKKKVICVNINNNKNDSVASTIESIISKPIITNTKILNGGNEINLDQLDSNSNNILSSISSIGSNSSNNSIKTIVHKCNDIGREFTIFYQLSTTSTLISFSKNVYKIINYNQCCYLFSISQSSLVIYNLSVSASPPIQLQLSHSDISMLDIVPSIDLLFYLSRGSLYLIDLNLILDSKTVNYVTSVYSFPRDIVYFKFNEKDFFSILSIYRYDNTLSLYRFDSKHQPILDTDIKNNEQQQVVVDVQEKKEWSYYTNLLKNIQNTHNLINNQSKEINLKLIDINQKITLFRKKPFSKESSYQGHGFTCKIVPLLSPVPNIGNQQQNQLPSLFLRFTILNYSKENILSDPKLGYWSILIRFTMCDFPFNVLNTYTFPIQKLLSNSNLVFDIPIEYYSYCKFNISVLSSYQIIGTNEIGNGMVNLLIHQQTIHLLDYLCFSPKASTPSTLLANNSCSSFKFQDHLSIKQIFESIENFNRLSIHYNNSILSTNNNETIHEYSIQYLNNTLNILNIILNSRFKELTDQVFNNGNGSGVSKEGSIYSLSPLNDSIELKISLKDESKLLLLWRCNSIVKHLLTQSLYHRFSSESNDFQITLEKDIPKSIIIFKEKLKNWTKSQQNHPVILNFLKSCLNEDFIIDNANLNTTIDKLSVQFEQFSIL